MSRRTSATIVLVVAIVASMVADIAATRGWLPENHRSEWGWFGGIVFAIWAYTIWDEKDISR